MLWFGWYGDGWRFGQFRAFELEYFDQLRWEVEFYGVVVEFVEFGEVLLLELLYYLNILKGLGPVKSK